MPNIGVHLLVSCAALRHWRANPSVAPFAAGDTRLAPAFLHGSLLPDAGYFPRGDRLFSELAHLWRTGDLARAMLAAAVTSSQRAHAIGWLAHVLADLAVHPLINAAHGEWVHGDRARPVTSSEDEAGHMRLEFGLDSAVFLRYPEIRNACLAPAPAALGQVDAAFREVFGWALSEQSLRGAQRTCHWLAQLTLRAAPALPPGGQAPGRWLRSLVGRAAPPVRWMPAAWNESPTVQALFLPLPPPAWLLDEIAALQLRLPAWLDRLLADDLAALANHDLVTGAMLDPASPSLRTEDALRQLRGRIG